MKNDQRCRCTSICLAILLSACISNAQDSVLARTPLMGWNGWNHFACEVSDAIVRAQADALVASGMKSVGYTYILIDDCWQGRRDTEGVHSP